MVGYLLGWQEEFSREPVGLIFEVARPLRIGLMNDEVAERDVLVKNPAMPCLVDGLLERRVTTIASQEILAYGMVKRQLYPLLPQRLARLIHQLSPGQRTPAFVVDTEHASIVTCYFRLSDPGKAVPTAGIVRAQPWRLLPGNRHQPHAETPTE